MSTTENLAPGVLRRVMKELQHLREEPPEGVKLILNEENVANVEAWILGPEQTPYEAGAFRVRLTLGPEFPNSPPKGFFLTKIFHPNVSKTGEICVNTLKKDWKKELGIGHVLLTIKCLLIAPNAESALNEEAGKLLLEQYDSYARTARLMTDVHATANRVLIEGKKPAVKSKTEPSATATCTSTIPVAIAPAVERLPLTSGPTAGQIPTLFVSRAADDGTDPGGENAGVSGQPVSPKKRATEVLQPVAVKKVDKKVVGAKKMLKRL